MKEYAHETDFGFRWGGGDGADVEVTRLAHMPRGNGVCRVVGLKAGGHDVQMYVSPTGRSVRLFRDGKELT